MIFLLVAGIVALAAGLLAIVLGIPVKEFGFGNTLILSGVIGACTGLLILGLWMMTREIRALALRLSARGAAQLVPHDRSLPPLPAESIPDKRRSEPTIEAPAETRAMPISVTDLPARGSPPVQDEVTRESGHPSAPEPAAAPEPKRRNLLFSSMSRKERDRKAAEGAAPDAAADTASPRGAFEDAWPERARPEGTRPRTPSTFADKGSERAPSPAPAEGPSAVTVLKSGVVDGMAYSLYSDGSIEAQMPEGMMRFASIDELRAHLDQRP